MRETHQIPRIRNTEHRPGPVPLPRPNPRASDHDVAKMTGKSGPAAPPGHHHIKYSAVGDHRQPGLHSGSENSSVPPKVMAGRPQQMMMNRGDGNGNGTT
jgi:hypothetical protein